MAAKSMAKGFKIYPQLTICTLQVLAAWGMKGTKIPMSPAATNLK
jgi:hypothetical protein